LVTIIFKNYKLGKYNINIPIDIFLGRYSSRWYSDDLLKILTGHPYLIPNILR